MKKCGWHDWQFIFRDGDDLRACLKCGKVQVFTGVPLFSEWEDYDKAQQRRKIRQERIDKASKAFEHVKSTYV